MRIAMVTGSYPGMDCGVGDYTRNLARAVGACGYEIAVFTKRDPRVIIAGDGHAVLPVVEQWNPAGLATLLSRLRRFGPEIVHLQYGTIAFDEKASICLFPALCRRALPLARIAVTVHTPKGPHWFPKAGGLREGLFRLMVRHCDLVITTTAGQASRIAELSSVPATRAYLVPVGPGVLPGPGGTQRRDSFRRQLGVGDADLMLVTFGVIHPDHDYRSLLEGFGAAAGTEGRARLFLIGGGGRGAGTATSAGVGRLLRDMGLERHVTLTGYLREEVAERYLAAADGAVQVYGGGVSDARSSFATVIAFGLPVITTSGPDQPDAVRPGSNVLLVPPGDPAAMAAAIRALTGDGALRSRLRRNAAGLRTRYSWEAVAALTEQAYRGGP